MGEKELEQRLKFIESLISSDPEIYRRVLDLEEKLEGSVKNKLVEKTKELENKIDILTRVLVDLRMDFNMQSYSIKNKKDTE